MYRKLFLLCVVLFVLLSLCLVVVFGADSLMWSQTYGGTSTDVASSLVQTSDGGYAIAGRTLSFGGEQIDVLLVKTDSNGNLEWNQTYGGPHIEDAYALVETFDGGYAIAGYTGDYWSGGPNVWVVKTDASGVMEWNQTYGGPENEACHSLVATSDGGYAMAGTTMSFGAGGSDFWLVKTPDEYTMFPYLRPPEIWVESPQNKTYNTNDVSLNFKVDEEVTWMGYSLDGQDNVTVTGNTTLMGLASGSHRLTLYAEDTDENIGVSEEIVFSVDRIAPTVSILEPESKTYSITEVSLKFTADEQCSEFMYCLDGQTNVTINGNTTLTGLNNGVHTLTVYATDVAGNTGQSQPVTFTIAAETGSEPPPEEGDITGIMIALAVVAIVAVGTILAYYYMKRRKQQTRT